MRLPKSVLGLSGQIYAFDTTGRSATDMGWVERTLTSVPTSNAVTLRFQSQTAGAMGPAIDDVRVVALPAPPQIPALGPIPIALLCAVLVLGGIRLAGRGRAAERR